MRFPNKPWIEWSPLTETVSSQLVSRMICYGCGVIYPVCLPVEAQIIKAISYAFEKLHNECEYDFNLNTLNSLEQKRKINLNERQ